MLFFFVFFCRFQFPIWHISVYSRVKWILHLGVKLFLRLSYGININLVQLAPILYTLSARNIKLRTWHRKGQLKEVSFFPLCTNRNSMLLVWQKIWYLCIYVTAIKPNFHERFRADNEKNRNMPTKRMRTISRHSFLNLLSFWLRCSTKLQKWGTQWESNSLM